MRGYSWQGRLGTVSPWILIASLILALGLRIRAASELRVALASVEARASTAEAEAQSAQGNTFWSDAAKTITR